MAKLLEIIEDVFFNPTVGMQKAINYSFRKSLIFLFVLFCLIWLPLGKYEFSGFSSSVQTTLTVFNFGFNFLMVILYAIFIHGLVSFIFDVQGRVRELIAGFVFCYLPCAFLPIMYFIFDLKTNLAAKGFISFVLFFWVLYLMLLTIKNVYKINYLKAILTVIMPIVLFTIIYIAFIFALIKTLLTGI